MKHYCVISHTHWDREWYREYEIFRMRLLRVFDRVLHLLDNNRIPCFYFDGQVSALEDYLKFRPENEKLIKKQKISIIILIILEFILGLFHKIQEHLN